MVVVVMLSNPWKEIGYILGEVAAYRSAYYLAACRVHVVYNSNKRTVPMRNRRKGMRCGKLKRQELRRMRRNLLFHRPWRRFLVPEVLLQGFVHPWHYRLQRSPR